MNNIEKYKKIFAETFQLTEETIENARLNVTSQWDSVGQMTLVTKLEEAFDVCFDFEDIINMDSFESGKDILRKYNVEF